MFTLLVLILYLQNIDIKYISSYTYLGGDNNREGLSLFLQLFPL